MSIKQLARVLDAEDGPYQELKKVVIGIRNNRAINLDRVSMEAATLHSERKSPELYKIAMQPTPIYQAVTEDLKARARLTAILAPLQAKRGILDKLVKKMRKRILSEYADELSDYSNAPARAAAVDAVLAPAIDLLEDLESTILMLETYIKDIDQAGYHLTNVTGLMKILLERPNQIV